MYLLCPEGTSTIKQVKVAHILYLSPKFTESEKMHGGKLCLFTIVINGSMRHVQRTVLVLNLLS